MKKLHLDLRVVGEIPEAYKYSAKELSLISGANLGNLVFRHALRSFVKDFAEYEQVDNAALGRLTRENRIHSVLVSCANWLGTRDQDERANKRRADLLSRISCPVFSLGLGVQAPLGTDKVTLGPESQRLARVLSEKCTALSVRDRITQETLNSIGISNTLVTGCPSNFINLSPDLGRKVARKAKKLLDQRVKWREMRTCISEVGAMHEKSSQILVSIMKILREMPSFYVAQSPMLLPLIFGEAIQLPPAYRNLEGIRQEAVIDILKRCTLHFSAVDSWLDFSRTCDFSFGMRIHGTMVPLQAGVPSLLIGHDSRTSGLAEIMGIPMVSPDVYLSSGDKGAVSLIGHVAKVMENYDATRVRVACKMREFMLVNGIQWTEAFDAIARD